jgi:hypothetical protein
MPFPEKEYTCLTTGAIAMAGEVDTYLDARSALTAAQKQVADLAARIVEIGRFIQVHPDKFGFSNLPTQHAMPSTIANIVNANEWPSAEKIMEAINRFHSAMRAAMSAHNNIPMSRRDGVLPLPNQIPPWQR